MYGQCETTATMSYLPTEMALKKCGSMGIAIPGGAFHLVDQEGNCTLESGRPGELVYRGKNVTLGYAECIQDLKKGDEWQEVWMLICIFFFQKKKMLIK